jgi:hypothetical protein
MSEPIIIGAGLAGLLAAQVFQKSPILESSAKPIENHRALLRFRSDAVARLTGIDFREVTVRKGIWDYATEQEVEPSIRNANLYAQKVTGTLYGDRSIWNLAPAQRFIAPEDFYQRLLAMLYERIEWGQDGLKLVAPHNPQALINTAPLPAVLARIGQHSGTKLLPDGIEFKRQHIGTLRYRVKDCDLFQTIYYPSLDFVVYRASITKDLLIIETKAVPGSDWTEEQFRPYLKTVARSFGIQTYQAEFIDTGHQAYGKIVNLPNEQRHKILHHLTTHYNVYSLGRFATWRNILLDDVVQDAAAIRRLLQLNPYSRSLQNIPQ